jgi:hypothetical protein
MSTPTYVSPFTGTIVTPTDVSYYYLSFSANQTLYWPATVNPTQVPAARIIDCVASTSGLTISLPQGSQGTVGADILFRNLGGYAFTIQNSDGSGSFQVPIGISKYVYLVDNTTTAGTWNNVTFAAGASYADAVTLQGAGLTTINGQLATTENSIPIAIAPTLTDASRAINYVWTGGVGTLTLPSTSTLSNGWYIGFRNAGTGTLTIAPQGLTTINGLTTLGTNPQDSGFIIYQQATNTFFTIGLAAPQNVTFTSATYDVDSIPGTTFSLTSYAPIIQTYVSVSGTRTQPLAVTLPATTQIYILSNQTGSTAYNITFQISGSSSPPLTVTNGQIATVLSDGNSLYLLTQTTTGAFYAINGTAASPSFSFNSDNNTGTYLVGTSILGITANSTQVMTFDGTNTSALAVKTPGTLYAGLISGGTF